MVILIGGVGYAGKTLMAQKLLEKYHYPYLSIDHLKMGLYLSDIECGFTPYSSQKDIGEKLWQILKGVITVNIENKQNLIIEGLYLLPEKIKKLEEKYSKEIISFYLGFAEKYILNSFDEKIIGNRSVIENRKYENSDIVQDYIFENKQQKKMCENADAKYFEITNDYEEEMDAVYSWIDNEINRMNISDNT